MQVQILKRAIMSYGQFQKSYIELGYDISKKASKEFFDETIRYFLRESDVRKGASVLRVEASVPWKNLGDVHCQIVLSFFSLATFKSWRVGTGNASNPSYAHTSKPVVARARAHTFTYTLCRKVGLIISKSFKNFTLASL